MRFTKVRAVPIVLVGLVGTAIVAVQSPAEAAITSTNITSPVDGTHFTITDANNSNPFPTVNVIGTANENSGFVDILCYTVGSSDSQPVAFNVQVQDGSFSAPMSINSPYGDCRLRAVPHLYPKGSSLAGFTGPTVTTEWNTSTKVGGGPNAGKVFDYDVVFQGAQALNDYNSATHAGLGYSRLNYPDGSSSNYLWNGAGRLGEGEGIASRILVGGRDAFGPYSAVTLPDDIPGAPSLTYSASRNGATGVTTIKESNPLVVCPTAVAYPPTPATCPQFKSAGVRLERTIVANDGGRQVHITDVWRSTDGKAHTIAAFYGQQVHGHDYIADADTPVAFRLPWLGGFQTFTGAATYPGPAKLANTILVRDSNTALDGDTTLPRGAVTFDFPLSAVNRTSYDTLSAKGATFTVAAGGTRVLRQSLVSGTTDAEVAAKAAANVVRLNPYRADGLIKKKGAAKYAGNGTYNTTAAGQAVTARTKRSRTATFLVSVQNDGTQPSTFRVKGAGNKAGFAVKYLKGASGRQLITRAVVRGNYLVTNLAPGQSRVLRLVVTVKPGTRIGALKSWLVLATSTSDTTRKDAVKAKVRVIR